MDGRDLTADERRLRAWIGESASRHELWARLVARTDARVVAEIGVYRGEFAAHLLRACEGITTYYMVDPWRNLEDWNKPANKPDDVFERIYHEAMEKTAPYGDKRIVLKGRTSEVIEKIPDGSLDFAYIDGDHTLRGIVIDLVSVFAKVRDGGYIGGDDFRASIWQHGPDYEPTLVFPFAVHFAEAVKAPVFALPHNQFLIQKVRTDQPQLVDLTGRYGDVTLRRQFRGPVDASAKRTLRDRLRLYR